MTDHALFQPVRVGGLTLSNRVVLAPMTRCRATTEGVPTPIMSSYYRQRASAGLIVTEATQVSEIGAGGFRTPGLYSDAQQQAWKPVVQAIHGAGGRVFVQLWHAGRAHHSQMNPGRIQPVAPSPLPIAGQVFTPEGPKAYEVPRELRAEEIPGIVRQYADAAHRAILAGFDGVEIHAANGYLIDQFLSDGSNRRTDAYGGSVPNRMRFLLEVVDAVVAATGPARVGVRVSPRGAFNDMRDSNPLELFTAVAAALDTRGIAYLHVMEPVSGPAAVPGEPIAPALRRAFRGPLVLAGGYSADTARAAIDRRDADLVAFGVPFLANSDLVRRFQLGAPLNPPDVSTFYSGEEKGYTDYPTLDS